MTSAFAVGAASMRSCETAKTPMRTARRSNPPSIRSKPKVSRACAVTGSSPGSATRTPSRAAMSPRVIEPSLKDEMRTSALKMTAKYSCGPEAKREGR